MNRLITINAFCKDAKYFMVMYDTQQELGKIINNTEIVSTDITKYEIYRSIDYQNGDKLFVYDLKPGYEEKIDNSLSLLISNLEQARIIELVYPNIFKWVFDGVSIKAMAIIPSGEAKAHTTISRYGGVDMFIRILSQHLSNIGKMSKGITPNYNFLNNKDDIRELELSLGSINNFNRLYSIMIDLKQSYIQIINNSKENIQCIKPLERLDMKYWSREINPDLISEAKHIKLKNTIALDMELKIYPPCIKALTKERHKGGKNRFLLSLFLLSIHNPTDAKFIYYAVLGDEEREHVKNGNCHSQWSYIVNNLKRYSCPSCSELRTFCDKSCKLSHPLQQIQETIDEAKQGEKE